MKTIIRISLLAAVASLSASASLAPVVASKADWPVPTCWPPCQQIESTVVVEPVQVVDWPVPTCWPPCPEAAV